MVFTFQSLFFTELPRQLQLLHLSDTLSGLQIMLKDSMGTNTSETSVSWSLGVERALTMLTSQTYYFNRKD
jgi:hypothetical protein